MHALISNRVHAGANAIKCPFCYAYFPRRRRQFQQCEDCFREYAPVDTVRGTAFELGGRRFRVAASANRAIIPIRHGFAHESFRHPDLDRLRREYGLERITRPYPDEFTQQLALRDWVCAAWTSGQPSVSTPGGRGPDPDTHVAVMLDKARKRGASYFCTYKAMASVELASAFGWTARLVNVMHHMVYEIWSNQLDKWVLCDSLYNLHYEKRGVPLSAWEIRREHHLNGGRQVRVVWGLHRRDLGPAHVGDYAWYVIYMHNNFFDFEPGDHIHPLLMPRDRFNRGKRWWQAEQIAHGRGNKYVCKGMVCEESEQEQIDYPLNRTEIFLVLEKERLLARFQHNMPNYGRLEARVDGGAWRPFPNWRLAERPWALHPGTNLLEARCVNTRGVAGPVSRVAIVGKA